MRSLAPDKERATLAVAAGVIALMVPTSLGQIGAIALGAIAGMVLIRGVATTGHVSLPMSVSRGAGAAWLVVFFVLLIGLPVLAARSGGQGIALFDAFYRAGSLVFGGGHVVLPLLQAEVVPRGWLSNDAFLAGYGAAQAVPGPLFTFAAYLGAVIGGWPAAMLCLAGDLPALVPADRGRPALLGSDQDQARGAIGARRRERGRRRSSAGCALPSRLDRRHHRRQGLCARHGRLPAPLRVAGYAMARRRC